MFANPVSLGLRRIARRSGILVQLVGFYRRNIRGSNYEWPFERLLMRHIGPEDVVWDVGANDGIYARKFAEHAGQVIAFEPSPSSIGTLTAAVHGLANVTIENVALAAAPGEAKFYTRDDGYTYSESLSEPVGYAHTAHSVRVRRGDEYPCPTKAKIDVEGYEIEVLEGMSGHLTNPRLKALFIEVHFAQLDERGLRDAPARIVAMLKAAGFGVRWADPSHIFASRA